MCTFLIKLYATMFLGMFFSLHILYYHPHRILFINEMLHYKYSKCLLVCIFFVGCRFFCVTNAHCDGTKTFQTEQNFNHFTSKALDDGESWKHFNKLNFIKFLFCHTSSECILRLNVTWILISKIERSFSCIEISIDSFFMKSGFLR